MFRRIVVPLDGTRFSEAALAPARELARAFDARIEIVRALRPDDLASAAFADDEMSALSRLDEADGYLRRIVDGLRERGYKADMSLRSSPPEVGIAQIAELDHADVIVMTTHLRWKVDPAGGPSTTLRLFGRTRTPIFVWRVAGELAEDGGPDVDRRPPLLARLESPILVPLDGSTFAERALRPAETLAKTFGLSLLLAHAVEPGASLEDEIAAERSAEAYLHRMRGQVAARGVRAVVAVRRGTPFGVIDRMWREFDAGLIVIASHGRSAPLGTFLGSVAARLMEEVEAPVLVIPPVANDELDPTPTTEPTIWEREIVERS
jgi:nucleotide-binding universal stress UspA family protein